MTPSPSLKALEAAANRAALKVSQLTVALEKAQEAYRVAHYRALEYRAFLERQP